MPLIRCPKCGQAYDVPGVIAVRLPNSIATCQCGEWLSGSKAALLARLLNPADIKEIDLAPYRVDRAEEPSGTSAPAEASAAPGKPRSIRIVARGAHQSVNTVFSIGRHPFWIGRKGCHVELAEAELSIRHCSISLQGDDLVLRDAESHMGTFLDGERVTEAVIGKGVHLLRVGSALVTVEPTADGGVPVEPMHLEAKDVIDESAVMQKLEEITAATSEPKRNILVCIGGPLNGQE